MKQKILFFAAVFVSSMLLTGDAFSAGFLDEPALQKKFGHYLHNVPAETKVDYFAQKKRKWQATTYQDRLEFLKSWTRDVEVERERKKQERQSFKEYKRRKDEKKRQLLEKRREKQRKIQEERRMRVQREREQERQRDDFYRDSLQGKLRNLRDAQDTENDSRDTFRPQAFTNR